jgi:hypothetical protein
LEKRKKSGMVILENHLNLILTTPR